jgi:TolB-like protein/tetratricopeptide (TPR) repeat protein
MSRAYYRGMTPVRFVAFIALNALAARGLWAQQCPDGRPRPCGGTPVAAATRRVDPPLDDRTWIVVPFNNVTRAPDVDFLRDGSVNLLYLDLSRWNDIKVIDDARVADLARQVPEARMMPLSLEAATAMARRAGAGRLVMGNVIKQGTRTTVAAKVFDVRRGVLLRSPQQDIVVQDSLMAVYGRLAQGILNIAPPRGADVASVGTTSVDAYQQYLLGTKALKRFDLVPARQHLLQALKLDSNFALAHYKLAILIGWEAPNDTSKRVHAATAVRLGGALPARERTLMRGLEAFEQQRYGVACEAYGSLVKKDSSDVEALYGVGECSYHDNIVEPLRSDTTSRAFRGSFNTAIRVFERALAVDPTYHLAFSHILDALSTATRVGYDRSLCPLPASPGAACLFQAVVRRDGDSLLTIPVFVRDTAAYRAHLAEYVRTNARRRNLEQARDKAQFWVDEAPEETRALVALGHLHTLLGDAEKAGQAFARVKGRLLPGDAARAYPDRIEIAVKLGQGAVARQLLDSVRLVAPAGSFAPFQIGYLFGRGAAYDSIIAVRMRPQFVAAPKGVLEYFLATVRSVAGGGTQFVATAERIYLDTMSKTPQWSSPRTPAQLQTLLYALEMPRTLPPVSYPANDRRGAVVAAVINRDTARLRSETRALDSIAREQPAAIPDSGGGLLVAQAYLVLRDSTAALRVVRRMLDTTLATAPLGHTAFGGGLPVLYIVPRLSLMRAELEAAIGDRNEARKWYRRFLDLWVDVDPDFAPILERARRGYAAIGGT